MTKVLFVCLGNICRSPMAEFLFKDMVDKKGLKNDFYIASAGTSAEEYGNPVHRGTRRKLAEYGISCDGKYARQINKDDYDRFDYIITMEEIHIRQIERIIGPDRDKKVYNLLDFSDNPRDIADPWYTGNFDLTYADIMEGLKGFMKHLKITL